MSRVNVTVPDDLLTRARSAGLNISRISSSALADELDRHDKVAALDRYLSDLEAEVGPVSADERAAARDWADRNFGDAETDAPSRRTA